MLRALTGRLDGWRIAPVVIATQARVALGDEIATGLGARNVVVLVGERPGMSSTDSLGIYFTFDARRGRRDSERNCLSNIRPPHGTGYATAAIGKWALPGTAVSAQQEPHAVTRHRGKRR